MTAYVSATARRRTASLQLEHRVHRWRADEGWRAYGWPEWPVELFADLDQAEHRAGLRTAGNEVNAIRMLPAATARWHCKLVCSGQGCGRVLVWLIGGFAEANGIQAGVTLGWPSEADGADAAPHISRYDASLQLPGTRLKLDCHDRCGLVNGQREHQPMRYTYLGHRLLGAYLDAHERQRHHLVAGVDI